MSKIYVITSSGGSYDDSWQSNLFAVVGEEQAQLEVARLTEAQNFAAEVFEELRPMTLQVYEQVRAFVKTPTPPAPREPRGKQATKEAVAAWREASASWREANQPTWEANEKALHDIMQRGIEGIMAHAVHLGCTDDHLNILGFRNPYALGMLTMPSLQNDVSYSYEELELR